MKKIVLFICACLMTSTLFAQDAGSAEKKAGNEAWAAKNYEAAFQNFEKYLKAVNYADDAYVFNTAVAANKAKKYAEAAKYFGMAAKNKYKTENAYIGKAQAEEDMKNYTEMLATLDVAMKELPNSASLQKMYANYFLQKGNDAKKSNKIEAAIENYTKATSVTNKSLKSKALMALGVLYFNNGASTLQKANAFANTDKAKFDAEKEKADKDFKAALDNLNQAKTLTPDNANLKKLLDQVSAAMK